MITNQVQYSVLDRRPETDFENICPRHNLHFLRATAPLAGGFLTDRYLGAAEPEAPLENRSLTKYKLIIDDFGGWDLFQELLVCLRKIADKHNVDIAEVAARYVLQKPYVSGVIIGARHSGHLEKILKIGRFKLSTEDMNNIKGIVAQSTGPAGSVYELERDRDGRHGAHH